MWQVKFEKEGEDGTEVYHIVVDEEVTVGRKNNDIIIKNDQSISRKHAILRTSHPTSNIVDLKSKPILTVKDCSSKYGTFVNGKVISDRGTVLKHNDLITFGQCGGNFRALYTPLVVTTSCMETDEKLALKEVIRKLGGHVVDEWNTECTHLAMTNVKVTVKTVCALVSGRPVVLGDYFKMLLECCQSKKKPDDSEKYLPPVNEILLNESSSFHVDPNREHLFKDKTFVFLSVQQYKKLRLPITLADGKAVLMNHSRCDVTPELLLSSCVIQCPMNKGCSQSQTCSTAEVERINSLLQENNKRLIPESDIGLAVVHCSTEKYCNPDYEFEKTQSTSLSNEMFKIQSQTLSQNFVYVSESLCSTQSVTGNALKSRKARTEILSSLKSDADIINDSDTMTKASTSDTKMDFSLNQNKPEELNLSRPASKLDTVNMETETRSNDKNSSNSMSSQISSVRAKRPAASEEQVRHSKREKLDLRNMQSICPDDIKAEPPSPPPVAVQESRDFGSLSLFDADTQPSSQILIKEESEDTDFKLSRSKDKSTDIPTKRQLSGSDSESNKKAKLISDFTYKAASSKISDISPSGYLCSKLLNNTSKLISDKTEENGEIPLLCRSLRVVKIVDLVVKPRTLPFQNKDNINLGSPVRNFKKFKKSSNFGANRMPSIIGGRDLIVHTCKESLSELNEFLQNQETENTQPSVGFTGNTSFRANFKKQAKVK